MTRIRPAAPSDIAEMVALALRFLSEMYRDQLRGSADALTSMFQALIASERGCVLVAEVEGVLVGGLCGHVFVHPMSGDLVASEVGWWVNPETRGPGVRLLKAFEVWAREAGAAMIQMIAPNDRVGTFYRRVGYVAVETMYQRRVT